MTVVRAGSDIDRLFSGIIFYYLCAMFSKTFGYAIRAAAYVLLNGNADKKIGLQDLSANLGIPFHFLGKVMQDLVKNGILESVKGPSGGFYPNEFTDSTLIINILYITDGATVFDRCALGIHRCNAAQPCPLHHEVWACNQKLLEVLSHKTIGMMAADVEAGTAFLAR